MDAPEPAFNPLKFGLAFAFLCLSLAMAVPVFIARSQAGAACRLLQGAKGRLPLKVEEIRFIKHPTSEHCDVIATVFDADDERVLRDFLSSKLSAEQRERTRIVIGISKNAQKVAVEARGGP